LVKILPKTAEKAKNFDEGYLPEFFQDFEKSKKGRRLPNQPNQNKIYSISSSFSIFNELKKSKLMLRIRQFG
jgi:hypothetical protein